MRLTFADSKDAGIDRRGVNFYGSRKSAIAPLKEHWGPFLQMQPETVMGSSFIHYQPPPPTVAPCDYDRGTHFPNRVCAGRPFVNVSTAPASTNSCSRRRYRPHLSESSQRSFPSRLGSRIGSSPSSAIAQFCESADRRRMFCSPSPPSKPNVRSKFHRNMMQENLASRGVQDSIELNAWSDVLDGDHGGALVHFFGETSFQRSHHCGSQMEELEIVGIIGEGAFSVVYRVRNRVDKQWYALKKTKKSIKAQAERARVFREAQTLAHLRESTNGCKYILQYYASWSADLHFCLLTELCDWSLRDRIESAVLGSASISTAHLFDLVVHVSTGLHALHSRNLVHLDIKPDNIFFSSAHSVFKIGDLGLVLNTDGIQVDDICEGDCRYLPRELLKPKVPFDLSKADVFSFGMTLYEMVTLRSLPTEGQSWHDLRDGRLVLPSLDQVNGQDDVEYVLFLFRLIPLMLQDECTRRPRCADILNHIQVSITPPKPAVTLKFPF